MGSLALPMMKLVVQHLVLEMWCDWFKRAANPEAELTLQRPKLWCHLTAKEPPAASAM
jgi:hypothetical protein